MDRVLEGFNEEIGEFRLIALKNTKEDYNICKDIFTDESIMKQSTIFGQKIGTEKQIRKVFEIYTNSWVTDSIGEYKILSKDNDVLGITGFIISDRNSEGKPSVLNLGGYLKEKKTDIKFYSDALYILIKSVLKKDSIEELISYSLKSNYLSHLAMSKLSFNLLGNILYNDMDISYFNFKTKNIPTLKIIGIHSVGRVIKKVLTCKDALQNDKYISYLKL